MGQNHGTSKRSEKGLLYRFPAIRLKPRFRVKADISSGDNPRSKTLATFNPLFPKGNYFGVLATTGPGPLNFMDVHPHVETTFPHNVAASVDWIFQWRENVLDGVYSVQGSLVRLAGNSQARFVGHRPGTELHWQADRHLWFSGRLWNLLRWQVLEGDRTRPQPEQLGPVGRL